MSKTINLNQLLSNMSRIDQVNYKDLNELIEIQAKVFQKFFKTLRVQDEEVRLLFDSPQDAQSFYLDCHYGNKYLRKVSVSYDVENPNQLILKPIFNIIGLIDSREPGLCQISEKLELNFKMEYVQSYTNTTLELYIHHGQIIEPQCIVRVSETLPYLALGQLITVIRNEVDFKRLNAQIEISESEILYEPNKSSHSNAVYS